MTTIGLSGFELFKHNALSVILIILGIMLIMCLFRAIRGPRVADRVVAVNMMGTMVMVIIAILAYILQEAYLIDICILYAMISFLAVIVLTKIYTGVYREKKNLQGEDGGLDD